MAFDALDDDYFDYQRNFVPFNGGVSRVRKHYLISPDSNGNGVNACYFGGGENMNLLVIAVGNYWTQDFECQRYLDMSGLPNVQFIEELPAE